MQQTIAQFLNIKDFPFVINDKNGNVIYYEKSDGVWYKCEFDKNGNELYHEKSDGYWYKCEFDKNGNEIYFEDSNGCWYKREYDEKNNSIYYENSDGYIFDKRPKPVIEMTLQQIADKLGMDASQIRIKD